MDRSMLVEQRRPSHRLPSFTSMLQFPVHTPTSTWKPSFSQSLSISHSARTSPRLPAVTPKQSLPSLKTVFGPSLASPPCTPQHSDFSAQPQPRDSACDPFTSATKSSLLHPNKRLRVDSVKEQSIDTLPLPIPDRPCSRNEVTRPNEILTPGSESPNAPRSYQHPAPVSHSPIEQLRHKSPASGGQSIESSTVNRAPRSPLSIQSQKTPPPLNYESTSRGNIFRPEDCAGQPLYRSLSANHYSTAHVHPHYDEHRRASYNTTVTQSTSNTAESTTSTYRSSPRSQGGESPQQFSLPQGYGGGPAYPYSQAYYVQQQYDHQHGKSRKRSNLPKHSTEIMKRWFDENMQNPYPTEEQKRTFAAVANINLTQVSNWFINHRRRCPELRDKRDKGRSSGRDED